MTSKRSVTNNNANPPRNYILLIVVFSSLACISVAAVLAFSSSNLNTAQNWSLIGILLLFPFFVVWIISRLVIRKADRIAASKENRGIEWKIISSQKQKENINREVVQLAAAMKIPHEQLSDLRSAYIVAEDLALRKIQQEANTPLLRYVKIGDADFNAVAVNSDLVSLVQVTFVVQSEISQKKITRILEKASEAKAILKSIDEGIRTRLLLVIVTQLDDNAEARLRSSLVSKFSSTPVDIDISLVDFQGLQKIYSEA